MWQAGGPGEGREGPDLDDAEVLPLGLLGSSHAALGRPGGFLWESGPLSTSNQKSLTKSETKKTPEAPRRSKTGLQGGRGGSLLLLRRSEQGQTFRSLCMPGGDCRAPGHSDQLTVDC